VEDPEEDLRRDRLVDWITDIFFDHLKKVVAHRDSKKGFVPQKDLVYHPQDGCTALDEVAEVIFLPKLDAKGIAKAATNAENYSSVELDPAIGSQLHDYVTTIASMYRNNPFHSFDHACHVTMSVSKLLKRIVSPDVGDDMDDKREQLATHLHDYTHGINSDPLTIFAVVFSALIHDVDHRGVSNMQLIKEQEDLASLYRNKSVAEQNSLDISWDLLMSEEYDELRCCLFATKEEMMRFRQAIVNVVLATDIFDQELNTLRTNRWQKAFSKEASKESFDDLRATIVLEHVSRIAVIDRCLDWLGFNDFPYIYFIFSPY
jgi:hypothetical protein